MSDVMYNDWGNWKEICKSYMVHDDHVVKGFFEGYRWLSNFYLTPVWFMGEHYTSTEAAFQAAKIFTGDRKDFTGFTPVQAKKNWKLEKYRKIYTPEKWDEIKYDIMSGIVFEKFLTDMALRKKLIETGDRYLEETNHWHDNYWGVCMCKKCHVVTKNSEAWSGENKLGIILMKTRDFWK